MEMEHSKESSAVPVQWAAPTHARKILIQSQGSYYRMVAKSKPQIIPLNIHIHHLSGMSPILPYHVLSSPCHGKTDWNAATA